ncbi:MAG: DnaJ domain-containing protein [Oscillospiraceae bacterium]|nr:DnaJ domain-containing protein [Oscillospiraceae bacterium]
MWEILGISPTSDIKEIKSAYARLAKQFNPEEKPEEFKRIFDAYKAACRYARYARNGGNDSDNKESNTNFTASEENADTDGKFDFSAVDRSDTADSKASGDSADGFDFSGINTDNIGRTELSRDEKRRLLLKNMREIISDESSRNNTEMWLDFFVREELDDFIYEPQFRKGAADILFGMLFSHEAALTIASGFGRGSGVAPVNYQWEVIISVGGHKSPYRYSKPVTFVNSKLKKILIIIYIAVCLGFVGMIAAFLIWAYTSKH